MVGLRLFLPETWTEDHERMTRARVPADRQVALTKPEIAIEERPHHRRRNAVWLRACRCGVWIERGIPPGLERARPAMGRRAFAAPECLFLGCRPDLSRRRHGKRRQYHIPDRPPVSAEAMLADETWQKISWRRGTKGRLTCLFAARRVRVADGHKHRMLDNRMQCMPGDEVWLIGERRSTGEQKYYVSNLPADTVLATTVKASDGFLTSPRFPRPF